MLMVWESFSINYSFIWLPCIYLLEHALLRRLDRFTYTLPQLPAKIVLISHLRHT